MMFSSPDTLIPDPYNPLDWNRYLYARANPLRYTDPTGHAVDEMMDGGSQREHWYPVQPVVIPGQTPLNTSTWSPPSPVPAKSQGCSESNWSAACKDPTLISSGQVQTNIVYPTFIAPEDEREAGSFGDDSCVGHWTCWLLVAADFNKFITYKTNVPAWLVGSDVSARLGYEIHNNRIGYYTTITSVDISNGTDAKIGLQSIVINGGQVYLNTPLQIGPGQTRINLSAFGFPGRKGSINLQFTSDTYASFQLSANYP